MTELIKAVRQMAQSCGLENAEQINDEATAIGAVRMIESEYKNQGIKKAAFVKQFADLSVEFFSTLPIEEQDKRLASAKRFMDGYVKQLEERQSK